MEETTDTPQYPLMTLEMARGYLARAVFTQGPDFVYRPGGRGDGGMCSYLPQTHLPEDDPRRCTGCMVGVALMLAGREILPVHEGDTPDMDHLREAWNLTVSAGKYLYSAQLLQDAGRTWGDAYAHAESRVSRIVEESGEC